MAVKVIVRRIVPEDKINELLPLIDQMRSLARTQAGYIYGETLRSAENPEEYLVISNWHSFEHWKNWETSSMRSGVLERIDSLLEDRGTCQLYHHEFLFSPIAGGLEN